MWNIKKFLLILSVNLLFLSPNNLFAQSCDLKDIDIKLCKIYNDDQQVRIRFIEMMQNPSIELISIQHEMDSIDAINQMYVSDLLDTYGWPDNLSDSANTAIFLVIDHGDNSYSEKYFNLIKEKADQGVIQKSNAATLEDRILMRRNKPQKYGTQTKSEIKNDGKENVIYIWPIEDTEKVDELRISVGLIPLNAYIQVVEDTYKMKVIWDKNLSVNDF
ncbi:MAG: hypothetical protein LBP67_03185 [Bacteroidales bacterium]|jgi:hypothetical protein|nr:hypothetical protein [Bacteroidales bacterium]